MPVALSALVPLLLAAAPTTTIHAVRPLDIRIEGRQSTVTLLAGGRLREARDADGNQSPAGLVFSFLVVRKPGVRGHFTLTELRDFTVDGERYASLTKRSAGRDFEPMTNIYDPGRVHLGRGPT